MTLITNEADAETPDTPYTQEEVERIFAQFGGIAKMRERMRKFEEASSRLNDEYESLLERFPNKWVSMNHEGRVFVGDTLDDLHAEFRANGVSRAGYATKYLDPDPGLLIL